MGFLLGENKNWDTSSWAEGHKWDNSSWVKGQSGKYNYVELSLARRHRKRDMKAHVYDLILLSYHYGSLFFYEVGRLDIIYSQGRICFGRISWSMGGILITG